MASAYPRLVEWSESTKTPPRWSLTKFLDDVVLRLDRGLAASALLPPRTYLSPASRRPCEASASTAQARGMAPGRARPPLAYLASASAAADCPHMSEKYRHIYIYIYIYII